MKSGWFIEEEWEDRKINYSIKSSMFYMTFELYV